MMITYFISWKSRISINVIKKGKALPLSVITLLQNNLTHSNQDFRYSKNNVVNNLPETVKLRLELLNNQGTFSLIHAQSIAIK